MNASEYSAINTFYEIAKRIEEERLIIRKQMIQVVDERIRIFQEKIYEDVKYKENIDGNSQIAKMMNPSVQPLAQQTISAIYNEIIKIVPYYVSPEAIHLIVKLSKDIEKVSISTAGRVLDNLGAGKKSDIKCEC